MLDDARVSWRHATISFNGRSWVIEDHGSTNGTYARGQRIHHLELGSDTELNLGNATDGPRVTLSGVAAAAPQAQPQQPYAAQGANAGWAPQQQAPQQQQPGWQQPQQPAAQQSAPHFPQQQGPGGAAGRRRSTATAAPPRSTSSPSAA
ncbi:hypothetical protein SHKM778_67190 [Streptomyces sp. KM77-8]|uniref:FHA domain-containing protein n=1 Tax=Streptomyces haneummycinicus TaxID=3074435 RepID=A0AAT9HRX5_9ACTN